LAAGLLLGWAFLDLRFSPAWLLAPVVLGMIADWTENVVQLRQLARFTAQPRQPLEEAWIRVASTATSVKIALLGLSYLALGLLLLAVLVPALGKTLR
jgi:hypothetical protein